MARIKVGHGMVWFIDRIKIVYTTNLCFARKRDKIPKNLTIG